MRTTVAKIRKERPRAAKLSLQFIRVLTKPACIAGVLVLFFTLNREDFSFVIHLDRQPRTSRRREAQTGSRARSGSRSERTLDAVEHSRTLMEWWPFLIFHRGGLRIKVINNTWSPVQTSTRCAAERSCNDIAGAQHARGAGPRIGRGRASAGANTPSLAGS